MNQKKNVVRMTLPISGGNGYAISIDGRPIHGVMEMTVNTKCDALTEVTIRFLAHVNYDPEEASAVESTRAEIASLVPSIVQAAKQAVFDAVRTGGEPPPIKPLNTPRSRDEAPITSIVVPKSPRLIRGGLFPRPAN